jgi:two-component system cell cycle response regulator DivK
MIEVEEKQTILVAEDFEDTRYLLRLWLQKAGYRVLEARDGLEALRVAEEERPALIIMDIEMPKLDGLEATRRIRERADLQDIIIIAVSAYGSDEFHDRAIAAGCTEYVSTPFEPGELKSLIDRLLVNRAIK